MIPFFRTGTPVRYFGASSPSYRERLGTIVEVDTVNSRYRVLWTHEWEGHPIIKNGKPQPVRTWVQCKYVEQLESH